MWKGESAQESGVWQPRKKRMKALVRRCSCGHKLDDIISIHDLNLELITHLLTNACLQTVQIIFFAVSTNRR